MKIKKICHSVVFIFMTISMTIFLLPSFAGLAIESAKKPTVILSALVNNEDTKTSTFNFLLKNFPHLHEAPWALAFNSTKMLSFNPEKVNILKHSGDFYLIETLGDASSILTVKSGLIKNYSDEPHGFFLVKNPGREHASTLAVNFKSQKLIWSPDDIAREIKKKMQEKVTPIEGNPIATTLTPATSLLIPLPVELERQEGYFTLNNHTKLLVNSKAAHKAAQFFAEAILPSTGFKLEIETGTQALDNTILFSSEGAEQLDDRQKSEGYLLNVTAKHVIIRASTEAGFFYGMQSLRQLLPSQVYNAHLVTNIVWQIPDVTVKDYPRFAYRGLQLDAARHFIPAEQVKRLIDLMAIHKLNYFQWHLTDDEGWRVEIKAYPQLTAKGAYRGYNLIPHNDAYDLLPAYGSGPLPYGGYYTQQQIREIVQYAQERQITIVPEIDFPGHARALIMSLPNLLIDKNDHSDYTSIQGYKDNLLAPCSPQTYQVLDIILTEITTLFPGKIIAIGGDEVPKGAWEKSPSCKALGFDPHDANYLAKIQNYFNIRIQQLLTDKGKTMGGWEEIADDSSTLNSPLVTYIWNAAKVDKAYHKSLESGYQVVMAVAENLYFDLAYNSNPNEPGQYWAGYVDSFQPYVFTPVDKNKGQTAAVIIGVQGELWSENIASESTLDYLGFPKIASLAELAWTPAIRRNWINFVDRLEALHLSRLNNYGVCHRRSSARDYLIINARSSGKMTK